jgi:hypothetical protein
MFTAECISKTISYFNTHITYIHMISGFCHKGDENFALLGYYAASGGNLINYQHSLCTTRKVQFLSSTYLTGEPLVHQNMLSHFPCN